MTDFYNIPFNFQDLLRQKRGEDLRTSLGDSIRQHISLILTTRYGDYRFDPSFGCKVWDVDFEVPSNLETWKDEIKLLLNEAIIKHEYRIQEILQFDVSVMQSNDRHKRIHQRLDIHLEMKVKGTNEQVTYNETLYFSPYSLI